MSRFTTVGQCVSYSQIHSNRIRISRGSSTIATSYAQRVLGTLLFGDLLLLIRRITILIVSVSIAAPVVLRI